MLKVALKLAAMPALMLAAMPVQAVETLSSGVAIEAARNPFLPNDFDYPAWYIKRSGIGRIAIDPEDQPLTPGRRPALLPAATIMPEPMSWAMMIAGLTAIGWSLRSLHRRGGHVVSFV